jgi:uncharacterized repeat protein (TIGR01451 family)
MRTEEKNMIGLRLRLISKFMNFTSNTFNNFRQRYLKRVAAALFACMMLSSYANADVKDAISCDYVYGIKNRPENAGSKVDRFDDISSSSSITNTNIHFMNYSQYDRDSTLAIGYAPSSLGGVTQDIRVYRWQYHTWLMNNTNILARPSYYVAGKGADRVYLPNSNFNEGLGKTSAGGAVNQLTGELYMSSAYYDTIKDNTFSISVLNTVTQKIKNVQFSKYDTSEPDLGKMVSDIIIDSEGNPFVIASSSDGKNYIVRLDMKTKKYNTITSIKNAFTSPADAADAAGMAFLNGYIYVYKEGQVYKIDPISGDASLVSDSGKNEYTDLDSCQLVPHIQGNIYNDVNGDGNLDGSEKTNGVADVTVELYDRNFKLLSTQTTKDLGSYDFIINDTKDAEFYIRVVNPAIDGKNAAQTWASGGSFPYQFGGENTVINYCTDFSADDTVGNAQSRACYGARADGVDSAAGSMTGVNYYSKVIVKTDKVIARADFAFTTLSDRSDAPQKYTEAARGFGVKDTLGKPIAYLGSEVSADSVSKASADATGDDFDDGLFVLIGGVEIPMQDAVLVRGQTYTFKAYINGIKKNEACIKYFIGLNANSGDFLEDSLQDMGAACTVQSAGNSTELTYKIPNAKTFGETFLRTIFTAQAKNSDFNIDYKGDVYSNTTPAPWVLSGEVEDYKVIIAAKQIRLNVKSVRDIGSFAFGISNVETTLPSTDTRTIQTATPNVFANQPYDGSAHFIKDAAKDVKISGVSIPSKFGLVTSETKCVGDFSKDLNIEIDANGDITIPSGEVEESSDIVCGIVYDIAPTLEFVAKIANRAHADDNFNITIKDTNNSNAIVKSAKTSAGSWDAATGVVKLVSGNKYTLDEVMAEGSVNAIGRYSQAVDCVKDDKTILTTDAVPFDIVPVFGENIKCEIKNDGLIGNLTTSTIAVEPQTQRAGSQSVITVTVKDDLGNAILAGGDEVVVFIDAAVVMTLTNGTSSQISSSASVKAIDNNDGTYTAFISSNITGLANVTFTLNGNLGLSNTTANFTHSGSIDIETKASISANPKTINAGNSSAITVSLKDEFNNAIDNASIQIVILSGEALLSNTINHNNGTYSANVTSNKTGEIVVGFKESGKQSALKDSISVTHLAYSLDNSHISANFISLSVNENSTISVTIFDIFGNPINAGGEDVVVFIAKSTVAAGNTLLYNGVSGDAAFISAFDHSNGTYTVKLASVSEGVVTLGFKINGEVSKDTISVEFKDGDVVLLASLSASVKKAKIGDIVKYTAVIENIGSLTAANFTLSNIIPFGFSYVDNSIYINGGANFSVSSDKAFDIGNLTLLSNGKMEIVYMLRVGASAKQGVHTTTAAAYESADYALKISNAASAQIEITADDPMLDDSLIIGTVFNDKNGNMVQDEGEEGLLGVKIVTIEGYIITTDQYGRFHLLNVKGGAWERGRNFMMKIDPSSLPKGFEFTTANPLVRRITPGIPTRFDFGVKLPNGIDAKVGQRK